MLERWIIRNTITLFRKFTDFLIILMNNAFPLAILKQPLDIYHRKTFEKLPTASLHNNDATRG